MKVFKLAQQYDMKHTEFIPLINELGFNIKGFSQELSDEEVGNITSAIEKAEKEKFKAQSEYDMLTSMMMVGVIYNPKNKKYRVGKLNLSLEQFEELGGILMDEHGTIFNAKFDLAKCMNEQNFHRTNKLDK